MTKDERIKVRKTLLWLADMLMYAESTMDSGDCNNCGKVLRCAYIPKPGQLVRINCPLWAAKEDKKDDD